MYTLLIVLFVLTVSAFLTGAIRIEIVKNVPKVDEKKLHEECVESMQWWKK